MFSQNDQFRSGLQVAVYATCIAVTSVLVGWSALSVGVRLVHTVDTLILDGSGQQRASDVATNASLGGAGEPAATSRTEFTNAQPGAAALPAEAGPSPETLQSDIKPALPAPRSTFVAPVISTDNPVDDPTASFHNGASSTFRTYCVRLCDGYFWPISFSTTSDRFDQDEKQCASACGSPARLFVHRVPGGGPGTMVSPEGLAYSALKTAFAFRTKYDAQCTCRAQPWEQHAQDKHRLYAAAEAARKGDKQAAAEAKRLAVAVELGQRQLDAVKQAGNDQATRELAQLARKTGLEPPEKSVRVTRLTEGQRLARAALREDGFMGLGASSEPEPPSKGGWRPASGTNRGWKERVFGDN